MLLDGGRGGSSVAELRLLAFLADRETARWDAGQPVRASDAVARRIVTYQPIDMPPSVWDELYGFVRSAAERAAPSTAYRTATLMSVISRHAEWCHRQGLPIEDGVVFHPDTIDRFVTEGCADRSQGTRLNYRTQLRRVGEHVVGPTLFPPRPVALQRSERLTPYSEADIAALLSWSSALPTELMRRGTRALLVVGLGAGLTPQELSCLVGTDIVADVEGVSVQVSGPRSRIVPVLARWEDRVADLAELGPRPVFSPDRDRVRRNDVQRLVERCPRSDAPRLNVQRLRATWIVHHLEARTPLRALEVGAGVQASQLVEYLPQDRELQRTEVQRLLRLAGS